MPKDFLKHVQHFLFNPGQIWPYPRLLADTIVWGLVLSMTVIITLRLLGAPDDTLFGENGVLETLQVIALCTASIVAILAAVRLRPAGRFVATTTALLCLIFFVREIPSCRPDLALACVPREAHRIVPAVGSFLLLLQAFLMYRTSPPALLQMIHPAFSWPLAFIAALLFAGEIFEELNLEALEEISELTAYLGLLFSAAWMLRTSFRVNIWQSISDTAGALLQRLNTPFDRRR